MTWLAMLFVALGTADLVHDLFSGRRPHAATAVGAVIALALGLGATGPVWPTLPAGAVVVTALLLWRGHHAPGRQGRRDAGAALATVLGATLAGLAASGLCPPATGPVADWLRSLPLLGLGRMNPDRALLLLGAFLLNLSTGNLIVRDALVVAGVSPTVQAPARGVVVLGERRLRGGRVLGPMERILVLGFGAVGNLTAAGLVVAAKGLVRFPELNSVSKDAGPGARIDEVTEYFLIGTFASILLALATVTLAG